MTDKELLRALGKLFFVREDGGIEWGIIEGVSIRNIQGIDGAILENAFIEYLPEREQRDWLKHNS
jgi:hypothetical protein